MTHDKTLIEKRFARALHRYNTMAVVQQRIARKLASMLPDCMPRKGLEIGAGSGFLTRCLVERFPDTQWTANDITSQSAGFMPESVSFIAGDGENIDIPAGIDLVTSASTVQWFDSLPDFVSRTYNKLADDGILAISTFGPENFREINESLRYYTATELQDIFTKSGFSILHRTEWIEQMEFDTPIEVLRHIKATGVNAISNTRWSPRQLQHFIDTYPDPHTLTFHPIIIIGKKI